MREAFTLTPALSPVSSTGQALRERGSSLRFMSTYPCPRSGAVAGAERTQLWWDLPVIESFDLLRDIYRVPRDMYARNRDEFIEVLDLGSLLDVPN